MIYSRIASGFLAICLSSLILGCGGAGGGTPSATAANTSNSDPVTPPVSSPLTVREKAQSIDSYAIYYGALDNTSLQRLKSYPLVIVHPHNGNITRPQIQELQQGVDASSNKDDVIVLCYISIGEDSRTYNLSDAQMLADPRFVGDGTGPSIDPRGVGASNRALTGFDPLGSPTHGGFASWYLNDNATYNASSPVNVPDQNPYFLTRYVNAGDPKWYDIVNNERVDDPVPSGYPSNPLGLKEMLTTTYGQGLGCNGVFLDTVDTAAPNFYAPTLSNFEWTAKGFTDFIKHVRQDYPDKIILQNRGAFFFDPRIPHYEVSARGTIDFFFFESYRMDSDSTQIADPYFFPDNKYNFAPKLMAEANRADGFRVLSLGYADGWNGPKAGIDINTLLGTATLGFNELTTDIDEAMTVGFRHYLTDSTISFINPFTKTHANLVDTTPPQWSSIYNANYGTYPTPASALTPRVGIQAASGTSGSVTVSWDVALDMNRVSYALYYKSTPFDFANDPNLASATRVVLNQVVGAGYSQVWTATNPNTELQNVYPYQQTLSLPSGTYYFVIRAFDSTGNEEKNTTVLNATI